MFWYIFIYYWSIYLFIYFSSHAPPGPLVSLLSLHVFTPFYLNTEVCVAHRATVVFYLTAEEQRYDIKSNETSSSLFGPRDSGKCQPFIHASKKCIIIEFSPAVLSIYLHWGCSSSPAAPSLGWLRAAMRVWIVVYHWWHYFIAICIWYAWSKMPHCILL